MPKSFEENGVLDHIAGLSSAEDIFTYLLLPYEQEVLNIARLHIMKRLGQYLRDAVIDGQPQEEVFLEARAALKRAYMDFVASTPIQEKVFKVHKDEEAKQKARFVGIDSLKLAAE